MARVEGYGDLEHVPGSFLSVESLLVVIWSGRRSTMEIHPTFSAAPHFRGSIPHPKTDFQQESNCIPMNNPMAQVCENVIFRSKIGLPTFLGHGAPSFRKYFSGKVLPLA